MAIFKIELGTEVTESITGYKGTVTARCEYTTGCVQYQVTPKCKAGGKYDEGCWLDEDRLIEKVVPKAVKKKSPRAYTPTYSGGPQSNPPPL